MKTSILNLTHVEDVVRIHINTFEGFFLTNLGERFLKLYYKSCIKNQNLTIAIGLFSDNSELIGFGIGSYESKGYYKKIIKANFLAFFLETIIIAVSKPMALIRLAKNLDKVNNIEDNGIYCELLSIGVQKHNEGKGYGKQLLIGFEKIASERGVKKITLTTDSRNNDRVLKFYNKMGYDIFYKFKTYPNREMLKLQKKL